MSVLGKADMVVFKFMSLKCWLGQTGLFLQQAGTHVYPSPLLDY